MAKHKRQRGGNEFKTTLSSSLEYDTYVKLGLIEY